MALLRSRFRLFALAAALTPALPLAAIRYDGIDVDSTADIVADDGACTFREAILSANQARANDDCAPGGVAIVDEIRFVVGSGPIVVRPTTPLPPLLGPTAVRGDRQPGYGGSPLVRLDGAALSGESAGLDFRAPGSLLVGLAVQGFPADAIRIDAPATEQFSGVKIGRADGSGANEISGNGGAAVHIVGGNDHRVFDNDLDRNGGLGIDLGASGRDTNDLADADEGPNGLQNSPTILWTLQARDETRVALHVATAPDAAIAFAVWATALCHPSGAGAGRHRLAVTESFVAGASGEAEAVVSVRPPLPIGTVLTATASEKNLGTSEFSACFVHGSGAVVDVPALGGVGAAVLGVVLAASGCAALARRRAGAADRTTRR